MKPKPCRKVTSKSATKKSISAQEACVYCCIDSVASDHSKNASRHGPSGIAVADKKMYKLFRRKYRYGRKTCLKMVRLKK